MRALTGGSALNDSNTDGHRFATLSQMGTDWGKGDGVRTNFELPEGSLCDDLSGRLAIHKLTANGTATSPLPPGVPAIDSDKFACAFVTHLSRYATGAEISRIMEISKTGGHGVRAMIHEPAASPLSPPLDDRGISYGLTDRLDRVSFEQWSPCRSSVCKTSIGS